MIELLIYAIITFIVLVGLTFLYDDIKKEDSKFMKWYSHNIFPRNAVWEAVMKFLDGPKINYEDWTRSYTHKNNPPTTSRPGPVTNPKPLPSTIPKKTAPTSQDMQQFNNMVKQFQKQVEDHNKLMQQFQAQALKQFSNKKKVSQSEFQRKMEEMKKKNEDN